MTDADFGQAAFGQRGVFTSGDREGRSGDQRNGRRFYRRHELRSSRPEWRKHREGRARQHQGWLKPNGKSWVTRWMGIVSDLQTPSSQSPSPGPLWMVHPVFLLLLAMILTAMAGGMAWGIRDQYGHELGVMIFGILAGFTLVMLFMPNASSLQVARVVALFTVAIGFGGSMTYGETVGLTHDVEVHGNASNPHWNEGAFRWGMLGLAIKGGLWIGFAGAFLGLGMGGKKYRPLEMLAIGLGMLTLVLLGKWVLNSPFDPDNKVLPTIYFSDHWRWEPEQYVNPCPEMWGGMLFAFIGLMVYLQFVKRDRLARNLAFWGLIGGLGFPIGQSLQAANAWDSKTFSNTSFWQYGVNSWNMMEVTFGTVAGLFLGLGVWLNRKHISQDECAEEISISITWESWLVGVYMYLMTVGWYFEDSLFGLFYAYGHLMGIIPMVAIMGGRYWPYLYTLPIVAMPIAVKTFQPLCIGSDYFSMTEGWITLVTLPLLLLIVVALHFGKQSEKGTGARPFTSIGLLLTSALYFWLNFAFFSFPWRWWNDWKGWAGQTNSGAIYIIGWLTLSVAAFAFCKKPRFDREYQPLRPEIVNPGPVHPRER